MNIRLHRADDYLSSSLVFTHEPLILSVGDHLAAARLGLGPQGPAFGLLLDATGSLVIFNWHHW
jgi:hypothetical protein